MDRAPRCVGRERRALYKKQWGPGTQGQNRRGIICVGEGAWLATGQKEEKTLTEPLQPARLPSWGQDSQGQSAYRGNGGRGSTSGGQMPRDALLRDVYNADWYLTGACPSVYQLHGPAAGETIDFRGDIY